MTGVQKEIDFSNDKTFGGQLKRLYEFLNAGNKVTCEHARLLGIAGSAFARRIKDLRDKYKIAIQTEKVSYTREFDGKKVKLSQYEIVKE